MLKRGKYLQVIFKMAMVYMVRSWRQNVLFCQQILGLDLFSFVSLFCFFGRLRLPVSITDQKEFLPYDLFEKVTMLEWEMSRCRSVYWFV